MSEKKNLLVFAGAGASVSLGYPTTKQFMENLPTTITDTKIYKHIVNLDEIKQEGKPLDIEVILWKLKEIEAVFQSLNKWTTSLEGIPYGHPNYNKIMERDFFLSVAHINNHGLQNAEKEILGLKEQINKQVHVEYNNKSVETNPNQQEEMFWLDGFLCDEHIFNKYNIDIFTTNYDQAIETSVEEKDIKGIDIFPFRKRASKHGLEMEHWQTKKSFKRNLWLTKLHGSLDWQEGNDGDIIPSRYDFSQNHTILYPGFKGEPKQSPFKEFHRYFAECLEKCDIFLSIGFSFRDDYINELIENKLGKQSHFLIMDPNAEIIAKEKLTLLPNPKHQIKERATEANIQSLKRKYQL